MILLPAIDMKDGRCVRLKKGDFATVHQVANSALETAGAFAAEHREDSVYLASVEPFSAPPLRGRRARVPC